MMRCIENAIAAGYITRDRGRELQGEVEDLLRRNLAPEKVRERLEKDLEMEAKQRRRRALLQEARRVVLTEQVMQHRNARGELDPAGALMLLIENYEGARGIQDAETLKWVILRQAHAELADLLDEFHKGALTGDLRRRNKDLVARMDNIVRELFGEDSGDARAKHLAKSWATVAENLRKRSNLAGANIGKLDKWGLPQSHDPEALLTVGRKAWVDYLMGDERKPGVLDRSKMVSPMSGEVLDDAQLRAALENVWQSITTDGWASREPSYSAYGKGALAKRRDEHHRFIHFKTADAWLAYMKDFKAGDPFEAMMSHMSVMARDIATLETFGPNPDAMRNYLKQLAQRHADQAVPQKEVAKETRQAAFDTIAKVLPGETGRDLVTRIGKAMDELADASRRWRANEKEEFRLEAERAAQRMDAIERELDVLEPLSVGERRAGLNADLTAVRQEIADRSAGRQSGLNRQRLERARLRATEIEAEIRKIDAGDTSVAATEPAVYQELIDAFAALKAETRAMRDGTYWNVLDPSNAVKKAIVKSDAMWDLFRGNSYAPISSNWANAMQSTRNLFTSVLLGSASLSTLADIGNIRQARWMAGMDPGTLKILGGYIDMLRYDRKAAMEAGLMLDSAVHVMHSQARYLESAGFMSQSASSFGKKAVQWTGFAADRVITLSGMAWMTQAAKWSFGTALQLEYGKQIGKTFDELPDMMRTTLVRHGITEGEWDKLRAAELYRPMDGIAYLRPAEVAKVDQKVAEKWLSLIHRETRFAVVEGTLKSRTVFGGGRPGTLWGEVQRGAAQFKSFGVAVVMLHIGRIVREWQAGNKANAAGMTAGLAITGALIGALVNELIEIVNGRDPKITTHLAKGEAPDATYWGKAILKAGGLGIYGDILFSSVSFTNSGLASALLGPTGQAIDRVRKRSLGDTLDWYEGKSKDGKVARDAISTLREVMPGSTLWYLRLVKERWGLNQLSWQLDPRAREVFRRHEQLQQKRDGNSYWWAPGDALPARAPMLWPDAGSLKAPPKTTKGGKIKLEPPAPKEVPAAAQASQFPVGHVIEQSQRQRFSVVDGDTVQIGGQRWRIEGYDAPEVFSRATSQGERNAGVQASLRLQELIRQGRVQIEVTHPPDKWGRGRAKLTVDGNDVAAQMKREGHVKRQSAR